MHHANIRRTPIIFAALAALVLAIAGFATLYHQAEAQDGSAPARPRTLTAPVVAHNSVTLSWRDPQDNSITGYVILRRDKAIHEEGVFITVEDDTNSADTTHTDNTVEPSTKYVYRIKAINAAGLSEISSWVRAYTPPAKPTGLIATATHDSVTLTWDDPGDDSITGYVVLRRIPGVDPEGQFNELVPDTGTAALTYTDGSVSAETRYTYRIKAINEHGTSERSRWLHIDTAAAPEAQEEQAAEPPDRPSGLSAAAFHDQVTLTWDNPQDDSITGYVILRRNRDTDAEGHFDELAPDTGTAAATYTDGAVAAETPYTYRIKAINQHGTSERSRWLHIDTPAAPAAQQNTQESADPPTATEPEDGDFADSTATTGLVAVGESIVGRIGTAGDVDWILVQAGPGQWFTITLTGYGEGDHTALETPHQKAYHQPDGSVLVSEHALNKDRPPCSAGCTHVEVSQAGSRYVAVASLVGNNTQNTGSYRLTVTLERAHEGVGGGVDLALDVSDGVDTQGFLRMLTPQEFPGFNPSWNRVFGAIPPGDIDWYRIDLEAGKAYRFGLRQSDTDLRLRLRDSGGTVIDSIGSGRTIHAAACAEGSHYIEVFRPDDAPPGHHQLRCRGRPHRRTGNKSAQRHPAQRRTGPLDWQCYGIADSHQVQFRQGGQWTTLSPNGGNPAGIELEYLSEGFAAKVTGLPTGDQYPDYEFRISRVVDGVAATDHREVSIVVIPGTPGNLRGGWNLRYYPDALTFEWDAAAGDNVDYEVQIREQQNEEWLDLGPDPLPGLIHRRDGKTRIKILAASPRYVSLPQPSWTLGEHVLMRVRATQYGQASPWSEPFEVWFADQSWLAVGTRGGAMTGHGQATLTWGAPDYFGDGAFRPVTTFVMYRMDGEWLHLLPGHEVNGVTVAVQSNRAVVSGLPAGQREYEFAIRHLGRHTPPQGTSLLVLSGWSRTITITTDLEAPGRPDAEQIGSGQMSVRWDPAEDATQYRLRLWTVDQWTELDGEDDGGVSVQTSGTTATVSGLPGGYYWYIFEVRALGPNGVQQSAWSPNVAVFNQHRPGG